VALAADGKTALVEGGGKVLSITIPFRGTEGNQLIAEWRHRRSTERDMAGNLNNPEIAADPRASFQRIK
jgi:hypothetical protein